MPANCSNLKSGKTAIISAGAGTAETPKLELVDTEPIILKLEGR